MIIPPSHNAISERLRADDAELSFRTPNNKNFLNNVLGEEKVECGLHSALHSCFLGSSF